MPVPKSRLNRRRAIALAICLTLCSALFWLTESEAIRNPEKAVNGLAPVRLNLQFQSRWEKRFDLKRGETFELTVGLPAPSSLPQHGRVGVRWTLVEERKESGSTLLPSLFKRDADAFGIYTKPTTDWKKVLHALDSDIYLVYRAPVAGLYELEIAPVTDEATVFEGSRWREDGVAPQAVTFPRRTPWLAESLFRSRSSSIRWILKTRAQAGMSIEPEPNDTPEQAQEIALPEGEGVQAAWISGGADDIEYFDNGKVGKSGDDWFRIAFNGKEPRLLTCNLAIPDHTLAAQLRFYASTASRPHWLRIHRRAKRERAHPPAERRAIARRSTG